MNDKAFSLTLILDNKEKKETNGNICIMHIKVYKIIFNLAK